MSDDAASGNGDAAQYQQREGATILELRIFSCRYIIGSDDNVGAIFCGENVLKPPYCGAHRKICYRGTINYLASLK